MAQSSFARRVPDATHSAAYRTGGGMLLVATAVILAALAFEYIGGYAPCPLCLEQRYAYYAGVPLLFLGLVLVSTGHGRLAAAVFGVVALGFLANAGLGVYHAGAEWKFWPGPDTCATNAGPLNTKAGDLLKSLSNTRVVRCDEAAWRLLGVSLAGWNALASAFLAIGCAVAAARSYGVQH